MTKRKNRASRRSAPARKPFPWLWAGLGAVALLAVAAVVLLNQPAAPAVLPAEITVAQAYEKYQSKVFFLDVRTPEEWETVHIPNTTLIPLDELPARVNELPKDSEIVVVCRSGNRSQQGRDTLLAAGFSAVTSMAGGVNAWSAAGYEVTSGK